MPPFDEGRIGSGPLDIDPSQNPTSTANAVPDPAITDGSIPDAITIGDSFEVTVEGTNYGGRGGHYSTITISSPTLDESNDDSQIRVTDATDHAYYAKRVRGDSIYDANGNQITADYALVEAGSDNETYWPGGESRSLSVEFTPETTGTFVVDVRVTLPDDGDQTSKYNAPSSSSYHDQQGYYVRRYEVEVREEASIEAAVHNLTVDSGTYGEGESVDADVHVENTGNREHTFFVGYSVRGPDREDYDNNDTTGRQVTLAPDEDRQTTLTWDVQSEAPDGSYDAQVAIWEESDPNNLRTRLDEQWDYDAFAVQRESIDAAITGLDPATGTYLPGEVATTTVEVENTGTTGHTFFVGYTLYGPDDGEYDNDDTTGTAIEIAENDRRRVDVDWTVPDYVPSGEYDVYLAVWEESDRDNLYTKLDDSSEPSAFTVDSDGPDISAQITDYRVDSGEFGPGEIVTADVTVANTGEAEHTFFVGFTTYGPGGEDYDNGGETGHTETILAGETIDTTVSWTVPSGAPPGEYDAQIAVWKENDRDALQTKLDNVLAETPFTVTDTSAAARIEAIQTEAGLYTEGQVVPTTVDVTNTGESEHTFFIGYSVWGPKGEDYDNNGTTGTPVTIEEGATATVEVEWQVTSQAPAGRYDDQVTVWQESDPDNLQTRLDDERRPDVFEVKETLAAASITGIRISSGPYTNGDTVDFTADIRNEGETSHTFFTQFTLLDEQGADATEELIGKQVPVAAEETTSVTASWTVPDGFQSGSYDVQIIAWSDRDPNNLQKELADTIQEDALTIENPRVTIPEITTRPDEPIESFETTPTVTVPLRNTGEEEIRVVFEHRISGPNGQLVTSATDELDIDTGRQRSADFTWHLNRNQRLTNGPHAYEIVVYTQSGQEILSRTYEDVFTLDIAALGRTDFTLNVFEATGERVANARLELEPVTGGSEYAREVRDGSAEFADLPTGLYDVVIEHGDAVLEETFQVFISQQFAEQVYAVSAAERISGAVVDSTDNQQVPNATVRVPGVGETTTDDLGRFALDERVPDGEYTVQVESPDSSTVEQPISMGPERHVEVQTNRPLVPENQRGQETGSDVIQEENQLVTVFARYLQNTEDETVVVNHYTDQLHGLVKGIVAAIVDVFDTLKEAVQTILSLELSVVIDGIVRLINALWNKPFEVLYQILSAIVADVIEGLEEIQEQQRRDNPYEMPNPRAMSFMSGWYGGYIGFNVVLSIVGAKVASMGLRAGLSTTDAFSNAIDDGIATIRRLGDNDQPSLTNGDRNIVAKAKRQSVASFPDGFAARGDIIGTFTVGRLLPDAPDPEKLRQIVKTAYLTNFRNREFIDGAGPAPSFGDPLEGMWRKANADLTDGDIDTIAGALAEQVAVANMLDGASDFFPDVYRVMSQFDPLKIPIGKKGILMNWNPTGRDFEAEFDLVEFEMRQLRDGERPQPVVTNVWEVTTDGTGEGSLERTKVAKQGKLEEVLRRTTDPDQDTPSSKGLSGEALRRGDKTPSDLIKPIPWKEALDQEETMRALADYVHKHREDLKFLFKPEATDD